MTDDIVNRRFGRNHAIPCNNPNVITCALWKCQVANKCKQENQSVKRKTKGATMAKASKKAVPKAKLERLKRIAKTTKYDIRPIEEAKPVKKPSKATKRKAA